ncbi:DNA polymerase Y family protein [Aquabacterium sp. A7-Y]|uniref:Y-family DNA polymerase n=1 Tax=Aquabacterium sp. A7-Y TaxID=1349605 RepID=UPI00223D9BDB|nr:DNA polymerase Y family protein [Aquabacterium sp. A7-Y]MCW7537404.1 DNA polymerase Y family protein [Aquabacterium sp. A7-Y]
MPYWLALLCPASSSPREPGPAGSAPAAQDPQQQLAVGWWALQFTPRVCLLDEAVLLEVHASLRLFGGARALLKRVGPEARELGCVAVARAPTALAALALARAGRRVPVGAQRAEPGGAAPRGWVARLDAAPLSALSATGWHEGLLERLGCRRLGDLRALPRAGLARRCGAELLEALDQAYGERPERCDWLALPEVFDARLELPGRIEEAGALMFAARRLLLQLCGWLAARQAGVRRCVLRWRHDFHRPGVDDAGELELRTAETTRDPEHLCRLLGELLARVALAGPVGELGLRADATEPLASGTRTLPLEAGRLTPREQGESLAQLVERLTARFGAERVLRPVPQSDHRPEAMQRWLPADAWQPPAALPTEAAPSRAPQPGWLVREPLPLPLKRERPQHAGAPLQLLSGPHRVEAGWWEVQGGPGAVARDYFIAWSERAGLLWVYREGVGAATPGPGHSGWFLHGVFG